MKASQPVGRQRPTARKENGRNRTALFSLLFAGLLVQNVRSVDGTVLSTELREFADTQLLFWSGFDCVIDAALNFFGPIDDFIRENPSRAAKPEYDSEVEEEDEEFVENGGPIFDNQTLFRDAKTIFANLVRGVRVDRFADALDDNRGEDQSGEDEEEDASAGARSTRHSALGSSKEQSAQSASWNVNNSHNNQYGSLQMRGGGRQKFEFSLFQEGDGSAQDPDGLPTRYVQMHSGNREKAAQSLQATLQWRAEHQIDTLLARPNPKFDVCREVFPVTFLGRDPEGHVILLQRPAKINLDLAKKNKLKKEDILEYYIYLNEYLWQVLESDKPLGTMISILDMSGLNMSILRKREYIGFLKLFISVMESHFPQRAHKTLIVNAPKWFHTLYRIFAPVMREETKSKIEITSRSKKQDDMLRRYLGPKAKEKLPMSFWHKKKRKRGRNKDHTEEAEDDTLMESEMDSKLRAHVVSRNQAAGKKMLAVA